MHAQERVTDCRNFLVEAKQLLFPTSIVYTSKYWYPGAVDILLTMDGKGKAQLQRLKGTRSIVEELDDLRLAFGFDFVTVLTPIVETRLRAGFVPPKNLKVGIDLQNYKTKNLVCRVEFEFPIGYPELPFICEVTSTGPEEEVVSQVKFLLNELQSLEGESLDTVSTARKLKNKLDEVLTKQYGEGLVVEQEKNVSVFSIPQEHVSDEVAEDNEDNTQQQQEFQPSPDSVYCCKICRTVLFSSPELQSHNGPKCTSYFLSEPPSWFAQNGKSSVPSTSSSTSATHNSSSEREGTAETTPAPATGAAVGGEADKLYCSKCVARVGSWSWAGSRCACGAWVAPAFQFIKSKLDEKTIQT
jgi:dual specificity phosphatase 12